MLQVESQDILLPNKLSFCRQEVILYAQNFWKMNAELAITRVAQFFTYAEYT